LGAGWSHFIREDRNLVELFEADGYQYIDSYDQ
jgi:alkaline phosphatase